MAISTLIVGIGGTGVLTVRGLRKLYHDRLNEIERVPAQFLAVDFDRSALNISDDRFDSLDDDEFLYLNPAGIQDLLRNLDRVQGGEFAWEAIREWFPDRERAPVPVSEIEANGASQLRALGRLGFFLNDELIEVTLRRKLCSLDVEVDKTQLTATRRVVLVSSLAGGTGAGMLLDMAYLIRRQPGRPRVYLYLMLPEIFQDVESGGRIFQNSYAFLKELAYLKDQQLEFSAEYPRIQPIRVKAGREEPFARIYLARGRHCSGGDAIRGATENLAETILAQLHRTVQEKALAIASNTLATAQKDEQQRKRTHCFGTAGNARIPLPGIQLDPEVLLGEALEAMTQHDRLGVADRPLTPLFKALEDRFEKVPLKAAQGTTQASDTFIEPRPPSPAVASPGKDHARKASEKWHGYLTRNTFAGAESLIADLRAKITLINSLLTNTDLEDGQQVEQAAQDLVDLRKLLPIRFESGEKEQESFHETLRILRRLCPSFDKFEKSLLDTIKVWLPPSADPITDTAELLTRWQFLATLKEENGYFAVAFPLSSPQQEAAQKKLTDDAAAIDSAVQTRGTGIAGLWFRSRRRLKRIFGRSSSRVELSAGDWLDRKAKELGDVDFLLKAVESPLLKTQLQAILRFRAAIAWIEQVDFLMAPLNAALGQLREWKERLPTPERISMKFRELPEANQRLFQEFLRGILPDLAKILRTAKPDEEPLAVKNRLISLIQRRVEEDKKLEGARFELPEDYKDKVRAKLVETRQSIFERRTPNPQRKAFGLIFLPKGLVHDETHQEISQFFIGAASQIFDCRAQVESYRGDEIWIYYEDLFNPPDHIWNLDEYNRRYQRENIKELFHVDRRFLDAPIFRDIHSAAAGHISTCGNQGCSHNIAHQLATDLICRGCGRMIRSRCGNPGCSLDVLDRDEKHRNDKACPACHRFNHGAWWLCRRHGKVDVEVPLDKERCPTCLREHFEDALQRPFDQISVRPDLVDAAFCPSCDDIAAKSAAHERFKIPQKLLPYYRHGVNGHDRLDFEQVAKDHKLGEGIHCPSCRTLLIPIHHEKERLL